jgi:hypothetical protein
MSAHLPSPYQSHDDTNPSCRWDPGKAKAYRTCVAGSNTIFDIVGAKEGVDFDEAKVRVARLLGRDDLIEHRDPATGHRSTYCATKEFVLRDAPVRIALRDSRAASRDAVH